MRELPGCSGKLRYGERGAEKAYKAMKVMHPEYRFTYYPCYTCSRWHVGRIYPPKPEAQNGEKTES